MAEAKKPSDMSQAQMIDRALKKAFLVDNQRSVSAANTATRVNHIPADVVRNQSPIRSKSTKESQDDGRNLESEFFRITPRKC